MPKRKKKHGGTHCIARKMFVSVLFRTGTEKEFRVVSQHTKYDEKVKQAKKAKIKKAEDAKYEVKSIIPGILMIGMVECCSILRRLVLTR